jgi:hypothetical protein
VIAYRILFLLPAFVLLTSFAPGYGGQYEVRTATPSQSSPQGRGQEAASIGAAAHMQPLRAGFEFPHNRTFYYDAEWRYFTAGEATLRIEHSGSEEHVSGAADSSGAVALLYRVTDRFNSYFDVKTLCSAKLIKHTEEGSHRRETVITYDYIRRKSILEERNLKDNQSKRVENDIPGCVTDVVSGIMYVASLPLQLGATYAFPLNDGGKTVTVQAHVEGKEQIKTPAGTFQTIRVGPEGDYGVLKNRGRIQIWYTDDAQHLPIQIRSKLFWGTLTVYLVRVDKG